MNTDTTKPTSAAPATTPGTLERDQVRAHLRGMWAAVAGSWDEHADYTDARHAVETEAMLAAAELLPGDRVLELACGAGGLGFAAVERVGPDGRVVVSDVSEDMVATARRRARDRGLTQVTGRVLELEQIAEPDRAFDAVLCRDGLQFVLDPDAALREMLRVLRPTAVASVAVWGSPGDNPWLAVVLDALSAQLGKPVPPPGMPGPFALADAEGLTRMLEATGFTDVRVVPLSLPLVAASFEEWWSRTSGLAGPLTAILRALPPDEEAGLTDRLRTAVAPYRSGSGLAFPGTALLAQGRRGD